MGEPVAEQTWLAERFEGDRGHLRAVAYRMLGSLSEAEDAVQESWLRLSRADTRGVENLSGWLTTVVARISLDMLRARTSRREESLDGPGAAPIASRTNESDPEQEALLADSVGLALLVVLETLTPAERLAFVLHDMFAVPFDEIAPIVDRSPAAARQLASRARRRVHGVGGRDEVGGRSGTDEREELAGSDAAPTRKSAGTASDISRSRQREVVDAFLTAVRGGDFAALLAVLDPDIVLRGDRLIGQAGATSEIRGAEAVARSSARGGARAAQPALVNGAVGVIVAPRGRLLMVLTFTIADGKIREIDAISAPERLRTLDLAILGD